MQPAMRSNVSIIGKTQLFWREVLVIAIAPLLLGLVLSIYNPESLLSALNAWRNMSASGTDSWIPMQAAIDFIATRASPLYQELFFNQKLKFQYPPTSLLFHKILAVIDFNVSPAFFNRINWMLIVINATLATVLGVNLARRSKTAVFSRVDRIIIGVLCFLTCLFFYPIMRAYVLGQAQVWINVLFAFACIGWFHDKKLLAGVCIGLICLIKPQFSLFLIWGMLRGQKQFVVGWLATVLFGILLSVYFFGFYNHLDYLTVLGVLAKTGESYYANQSVNGLLNRLLENGPTIVWEANAFPPYHAVVRWGTLLSTAAIVVAVMWFRSRHVPGLLDFQLAALAFTMASPIAWEHHYGILPLIYVSAYFALHDVQHAAIRKWAMPMLAVSYLLTANSIGIIKSIASSPLSLLYSYLFLGAIMLAVVLYVLTRSTVVEKRSPMLASEFAVTRAA